MWCVRPDMASYSPAMNAGQPYEAFRSGILLLARLSVGSRVHREGTRERDSCSAVRPALDLHAFRATREHSLHLRQR